MPVVELSCGPVLRYMQIRAATFSKKGLFSVFVQPEKYPAGFGINQKIRTWSLKLGRVYYQFHGQFVFILVTMATKLSFHEMKGESPY